MFGEVAAKLRKVQGLHPRSKQRSILARRIKPHPNLVEHQRECIEIEYDMENGEKRTEVRGALVFYTLRKYDFDKVEYNNLLSAEKQQIILENLDEIKMKEDFLEKMTEEKLKDKQYSIEDSKRYNLLVAEKTESYSKKV